MNDFRYRTQNELKYFIFDEWVNLRHDCKLYNKFAFVDTIKKIYYTRLFMSKSLFAVSSTFMLSAVTF